MRSGVGILPIVERELRVAVRQRRTWFWRLLTAGTALVGFLMVYASVGSYSSLSRVGQEVFVTLSVLGVIYCLLAGPIASVDCLARERREGTLGLLFLTDLKGYDVVLGKIAAASLSLAVGGAAAMPLFATPVLMGGVTLLQCGMIALALLNMMFLSLAIGACASSIFDSGRASLGVTLLAIFGTTLGWLFVGEELLAVSRRNAPFFYIGCPLYTMHYCLNWRSIAGWEYWLNMAGTQVLAWACLAYACHRTRHSRETGISTANGVGWVRRGIERIRRGSPRSRQCLRRRLVDRNPVAWLDVRDRLQSRVLWALCLGAFIFWAFKHIQAPQRWPSNDTLFLWPFWVHYVLCLWIAVQSPRRFADDKHSGALELVLCTSFPAEQIVRGGMLSLRQRFGRTLFLLLLLDAFLTFAYLKARGYSSPFPGLGTLFRMGFWAAVVFALQAYSFARVGLYQGLVQGNSLRATFMLIWKLGLLPYVLLTLLLLGYGALRQQFRGLPNMRESLLITFWVSAHLVPCLVFLAHSNWHLQHRFRTLASQTGSASLLGRWRRTDKQLA